MSFVVTRDNVERNRVGSGPAEDQRFLNGRGTGLITPELRRHTRSQPDPEDRASPLHLELRLLAYPHQQGRRTGPTLGREEGS